MKIDIIDVRGEKRLATLTGYAARPVMKEVPGARWNSQYRGWTYPLYYGSVLALGEAAKLLREDIIPTPEAVQWAQEEQAIWSQLQGLSSDVLGGHETIEGFFGHQQQCAEWLSLDAFGGRLDTSEMGTGKTRTTLRAAWHCWQRGEKGILLVSTLKSVKSGWENEVANVADLLPLDHEWHVFKIEGTAAKRRKLIDAAKEMNAAVGGKGVVMLVNHEQLKMHSRLSSYGDIALKRCIACGGDDPAVKEAACHAHDKELNDIELVAFVIDESHRCMNPSAQQTRAAWKIADATPRAWGLTGTPGSTSVMENTWALMRLVGGATFPPKSSWCSYYAEAGYNSDGFWEVGRLRPDREEEFHATYGAISRRVLKAQVLDLPPLLRGGTLERHIEMGTEQRRSYNEMRDKLRVAVEEGTITVANQLAQTTRLIALASSCGVPGPTWGNVIGYNKETGEEILDTKMKLVHPSNKIDAVVDMVLSGDIEPGTVFQFVSAQLLTLTREALITKTMHLKGSPMRRPEDFGVVMGGVPEALRAKAIADFQSGKIPFFGFTVAAGGAGITLTRANTMLAVERPWSPILWQQAQDRVHRIGSEIHDAISIIDLISEETIEMRQIKQVLTNRQALTDLVRDKERMMELLS